MSIKLFRLETGEQVVGEVSFYGETTVALSNPIILVPDQEGNVSFMPWAPMAEKDKDVEVYTRHIVYTATPAEELEKNYKEIFSPIITPDKKGLIL